MEVEAKATIHPLAMIFFLLFTSLFVYVSLKLAGLFPPAAPRRIIEVGQQAPDFTFPGLDGRSVSLSDYRGKVVLLNIWATWCPPCVEEMPSMQRLYQTLKDEPFEILAVSVDARGKEAVGPFMQKYKLTFPALLDTEGSIRNLYGATGIPESFIIDQQGILVKKIIGPLTWDGAEIVGFFGDMLKARQ